MSQRTRWILGAAICGALQLAMSVGSYAQSVQDFYKGKQITLLVITAIGGNGIYAGVLARHMGNFIPGHPTIVIQEMPAAAGLALMNHLYSATPNDGLTFGTVDRGMLLEPLLGNDNARFDASKMASIASIGKQLVVCSAGAQSKVKSIQQALDQQVLVGALSPSERYIWRPIQNLLERGFCILNSRSSLAIMGRRPSGWQSSAAKSMASAVHGRR